MKRNFTSFGTAGLPADKQAQRKAKKRWAIVHRWFLPFLILIQGTIMLISSLYVSYSAYQDLALEREAQSWVQTPIEVQEAVRTPRRDRRGVRYLRFDTAKYNYTFDGKQYTSSRIYVSEPPHEDDLLYRKLKRCADKLEACEAFVNPKNPTVAVIVRTVNHFEAYLFITVGLLTAIILPLALLYTPKSEREDTTTSDTPDLAPKFGGQMPPLAND